MRILVHDFAGHPFQMDLSRELARRGHHVRHAYFAGDKGPKGDPNVPPEAGKNLTIGGLHLETDYQKDALFNRWLNDIRYGGALSKIIRSERFDIILSGNTPLDAQANIIKSAHASGALFVNWIQDFLGVGTLQLLSGRWHGAGRLIGEYYAFMERRQLHESDGIIIISEQFEKYLPERRTSNAVHAVIPNWGAIEGIPLVEKSNDVSRRLGFDKGLTFLYSGTLGLKHNPHLLISLADAMADYQARVVVAATGLGQQALARELNAKNRANLLMLPLQPFDEFPSLLGGADVVVALLEAEAGEFSVPSKILSYLCAGRPILMSAPTSNAAAKLVSTSQTGIVADASDSERFIRAARQLAASADLRRSLGSRGRAFAEANFNIGSVADRFESVFERVLSTSRAGRE